MKTYSSFFRFISFSTILLGFHTSGLAASWQWAKSANSPSVEQLEHQVGKAIDRDILGNVYVTGSISGKTTFSADVLVSADAQSKDFFLVKYDANGNALWAVKGSSPTHGDEEGLAVRCFRKDVYVTGYISGSGTLEASNGVFPYQAKGGRDIFIAKYSGSNGALLWFTIAGGSQNDQGIDIDVDRITENVAVVGEGRGNLTFGLNNLFVPAGNNFQTAFVTVFNKDGQALWAKRLEGSENSYAGGVVFGDPLSSDSIDSSHGGTVFVGGNFRGHLTVEGEILATSVQGLDNDMGELKFSQDIFGILLSPQGNVVWHRESQEGKGMEEVRAVAKDKLGNFYLAGRYYPLEQNWQVLGDFGVGDKFLNGAQVSQVGGFCTSLDFNGNGRWINSVFVRTAQQGFNVNGQLLQYHDASDYDLEDMAFNDIQVSDAGLVYVVGSFIRVSRYNNLLDILFDLITGNQGLEPDGFVLVFDGMDVNGDFMTGLPFGQRTVAGELFTERDVAWGVAVHPTSGEAYVTGETFSKECHFGPNVSIFNTSSQTQPPFGDADLFLAKFLK